MISDEERMSRSKKQYEGFMETIKNHEMKIIHDDGVHRHIRFIQPETNNRWYELVTWPNNLCIAGDMGTYVFNRTEDMFRFFRTEGGGINPPYWGEKLQSIATYEGYEKFSPEEFRESVMSYIEYWGIEDEKELAEVTEELEELCRCSEGDSARGEIEAYDLVDGYKTKGGHEITDFWEHSNKAFTTHYLWCLRAIVHGIKMYDEEKAK